MVDQKNNADCIVREGRIMAGALALCVLLSGCTGGVMVPAAVKAPARPSRPVASSRFEVRGHAQHVVGQLADGGRIGGTLYPALPGTNTLRLRVGAPQGHLSGAAGPLLLTIVMPGMSMHPVSVALSAHLDVYQGTLVLPMFGHYLARIAVGTRWGHRHGSMRLDVPLLVSGPHSPSPAQ